MATPAEELDVDGVAVRLSNPDKVYFPRLGAAGGTKRHLVEYYRAIATLPGQPLVRALRDRPTYLQRFPDGIEGEEVYQKRLPPKVPEHVRSCRVTFPSGRHADALRVTNPADIVWAANLGTVTFHPWHATCCRRRAPRPAAGRPGPPAGHGFRGRRPRRRRRRPAAARRARATRASPRRSGGRGVHVFVATEPLWTFTQVRRAAIALAREIERRAGGRVTTAWWKEQRGEQVFIDYNQNARDRTIASAYSARRTPNATVSAPLAWDELADADPDDFTIATVPALVARRGDPMEAIGEVAALPRTAPRARRARRGRRAGRPAVPAELSEDAGRTEARHAQPVTARHRGHRPAGGSGATGRRLSGAPGGGRRRGP